MPMVSYKLTPYLFKFCSFIKFFKDLDLNILLTIPDSLPCKWNNFLFAEKHHKHSNNGRSPNDRGSMNH